MKLLINNQTFEFENKESDIKKIMGYIERINQEGETALSYIVVDGVEVYDQFEDYLVEHITSAEMIEVIVKSIKELVNDILISAEDYLMRALPEIKSLIDDFYQGPDKSTWDRFNELLVGLQWIHQVINTIDKGTYQPENWNKYLISLTTVQEQLQNLEEAIVANDHILMGDILLYEILPELERLKLELGTTIDHEGKRNHVN